MTTYTSLPTISSNIDHRRWMQVGDPTGRLYCLQPNQTFPVESLTVSKVRYSYPDWKERIAKKLDASTPYTRTDLKLLEVLPGEWETVPPYSTRSCGTVVVPGYFRLMGTAYAATNGGSVIDDFSADWVARADAELRKQFNKRRPDFNAVCPVGEWRETVGIYNLLVNDTFAYVHKVHDMLAYARTPKKLMRLLGRAGDYWLTWSFGIKPTLSDLRTAAKDLASKVDGGVGSPAMRIHGEALREWQSQLVQYGQWADSGGILQGTGIRRSELSVLYRSCQGFEAIHPASLNYEVAESVFVPDFSEVVLGIYDLIPYSWLLDYFTSTGEWLEEQFALKAVPLWGTKSRLFKCKSTMEFYPAKSARTIRQQTWISEYTRYTRSVNTTLYGRGFRWKDADEVFGLNKLLNLISLSATQANRRIAKDLSLETRNRYSYTLA